MQGITLVSIGFFEKKILKKISEYIEPEFRLPVQIKEGHIDLSDYYNIARCQYNANDLLLKIENQYSTENYKTIGLFNVDLYIPIFTYIFGQAFLNGNTGIASMYRLNNERYGIMADEDLLIERFSKEIIHELGHTFGLIHCHIPDCVMRSGSYVEDIDQKKINFCKVCRNEFLTKLSL